MEEDSERNRDKERSDYYSQGVIKWLKKNNFGYIFSPTLPKIYIGKNALLIVLLLNPYRSFLLSVFERAEVFYFDEVQFHNRFFYDCYIYAASQISFSNQSFLLMYSKKFVELDLWIYPCPPSYEAKKNRDLIFILMTGSVQSITCKTVSSSYHSTDKYSTTGEETEVSPSL